MTHMASLLPKRFEELERWSSWVLETETLRYAKRIASSVEEVAEFCAALRPHMEDVIQYLENFKWGTPLAPEDENLYRLGLSFMEASIPIDLGWKSTKAEDSYPIERISVPERR